MVTDFVFSSISSLWISNAVCAINDTNSDDFLLAKFQECIEKKWAKLWGTRNRTQDMRNAHSPEAFEDQVKET